MMADKSSQGDKKVTNALLNAATGFSFFDDFSDATLLVPVPVSVQQEILKNTPEATSEIDLQSDEVSLDDEPTSQQHVTLFDSLPNEQVKPSSDSTFISYFKKAGDEKDDRHSVFPVVQTALPPPPSIVPDLIKTSSAVEIPQSIKTPSAVEIPQSIKTSAPTAASTEKPPLNVKSAVSLFSPLSSDSANDPFSSAIVQSAQAPPPASTLFDPTKSTKSDFVIAPPSSIPHQLSSITATTTTTTTFGTTTSAGGGEPIFSSIYTPSAPSLEAVQSTTITTAGTSSADVLKFSAKTAPYVEPSSVGDLQSQGTSNKYRLGGQRTRPQYAQYPGLLGNTNAPQPMANMGSFMSQPPAGPPLNIPSVSNLTSTAPSSNHSQEYVGTGYVFGEPPPSTKTLGTSLPTPMQYSVVTPHWFYYKEVEGKGIWKPFSFLDSVALEDAFSSGQTTLTPTDGGRYDVDVIHRLRTPVYWEETPTEVRRCSWFYKGPLDNRFVPYEEDFAQQLEKEFEAAIATGVWQRRVELGGGEAIILHNPNVIVHFCQAASPDEWGNLPESQLRPRVVKRGVDKTFLIEDGESTQIDHLVFIVHGIGAICDFKFRSIVEAVDDFRSLSDQLLHIHFGTAVDRGVAGRTEFLPVCWHKSLHGDCGVDRKLKPITLHSIPKLRNFTNDTLLDILFYTSPVYCQRIVDTVGNEINRMYDKFLKRNGNFRGAVSLAGHSLGSLILFDLLTHQPVDLKESATDGKKSEQEQSHPPSDETAKKSDDELGTSIGSSKMVSYTLGQAGTGQPSIVYPAFDFHPTCFFALGSPTAVFISVRGIETLGDEFRLPTCPSFFNIFHPFDPVAYRMETLIDPTFPHPPVVIPHHKGRKRFHLEIKDAMFRMGTDLKQTMVETFKNTWKTFYHLASFGRSDENKNLEQEIDRALEGELNKSVETQQLSEQFQGIDNTITIGQLNGGRRIDYVLQEGPLESFNEYLFALSSHVCYWESEDAVLLILREIYQSVGIFPDNHSTLFQPATTPSTDGQYPGGPLPLFSQSSGNSLGTTNYSNNSVSQNPYGGNFTSHTTTPMFAPPPSSSFPLTDNRPAPTLYAPNYSLVKPQPQPSTNASVEPFVPQSSQYSVPFPNQSVPQPSLFTPPPLSQTASSQQPPSSSFVVTSNPLVSSQQPSPFVMPLNQPVNQQPTPFAAPSTLNLAASQQVGTTGAPNYNNYGFPNVLNMSHPPVLQSPRDPSPNANNNNLTSSQAQLPSSFVRPQAPGPIGPPPLTGFVRKS